MLVDDWRRLGAAREDVRKPLARGASELRRVGALATAGVGPREDSYGHAGDAGLRYIP